MQGSKIRLSPAEALMFSDVQPILTKNSIIKKTTDLLSEVQVGIVEAAPAFLRENSPFPKISKGENYLGLPYVILDYPRMSQAEDLCFVRSMFWWGNFYSSTLQVSGKYKSLLKERAAGAYEVLKGNHYYIGVNVNPWIHHFEPGNYEKIDRLNWGSFASKMEESTHIKIAARWPLSEWDSAANKLIESWKLLIALIT